MLYVIHRGASYTYFFGLLVFYILEKFLDFPSDWFEVDISSMELPRVTYQPTLPATSGVK